MFVLILYSQREGEDGNGEESDDDEVSGMTINGRISVSRRIVASTCGHRKYGKGWHWHRSRRAVTPVAAKHPGLEMKKKKGELLRRVENVGANKVS